VDLSLAQTASRPSTAGDLFAPLHDVVAPAPPEPAEPADAIQPGLADLAHLHPALWRAQQLGRQRDAVVSSGHAELDAELPGGGWPARALTELLLPHAGIGEWRLLAPALATVQRSGRTLMLFDPPEALCAWALQALGLGLQQLVLVRARCGLQGRARALLPAADVLWALEQALKSGHAGAVMAWLPRNVRPESLRRLQLAAQAHDGPAFLLREGQAQARPSAAPLRLLLAPAAPDLLRVQLLKRRGPPQQQPLLLPLAAVLSEPALLRAQRLQPQAAVAEALR